MKKTTFLFFAMLMSVLSWQGTAQSGSTCDDPLVVSSMPFNDSGNTSTYGNNYSSSDVPPTATGAVTNGTGSTSYLNGDDVVYSYTAGSDGAITINTTNDDNWIGLWVFTGCPFTSTVGYHVATGGASRSVPNLPVISGETYYIVISTWPAPQSTDFTINITGTDVLVLEDCTEAIAGTVVGDTSPQVCANSAFSMSVEGNSGPAAGLIRTWQSSPTGAGTWTDLNVASSTINITGINTPTDYRYHVECDNGESDNSEVISVSINPNADECYCIPAGTNSARYINNFSTNGALQNASNLDSGFSPNGYGDFYDTHTISQSPGEDVNFAVDIVGGSAGFRIWVDWNHDGSFDPVTEVAHNTTSYVINHTGSFTVPSDASEGVTRMRIVSNWSSSNGGLDPCATAYALGEWEDYKFEVIFPEACTGTPDAGTAIVNPISGNPGTDYIVSANDYTVATEMSFQWQSNTNGAGWEDAGAATDSHTPYTATAPTVLGDVVEWRLALTCTPSGETTFSAVATFTTVLTYCNATSGSVEPITRVVFAGIDNVSSESSTDAYEDFTAIVAEVEGGETYSFAAEGNTSGSFTNYFTVWIDWNHNGEFETDEMYEIGSIVGSTGTDGQQAINDIAVPADAVAGQTRMRVRKNFNSFLTNPCGSNSYGQTEDYTVNVAGGTDPFPSPYCDVTADSVEEITKVDFDGTVITNTDTTNVLIDKTDTVVDVMQGETYNLKVEGNTHDNPPFSFDSNIVAFIDWNQNGILDDAGEVYELGTLSGSSGDDGIFVSMDIEVPEDAVLGETRIRITKTYFDEDSEAVINPCDIEFDLVAWGMGIWPGFGQALDFTLNVEEGAGGSYCEGEGVDFGDFGGVVNFSTADGITNVDNQGIDDPTGYHNFTDMVITQAAGESFTFTADIQEGGYGDAGVAIYIDYNMDFEFDLVLPERAFTTSTIGFVTTITATITIPADTNPGNYRFRVTSDNMTSGPSPCNALGSIHDYTLTVTEGDGGDDDLDCAQGDDSNGFENGFNVTAGGSFRNADDFMVSADNTLNIQSIELNLISMDPITSLDLNFYNDENGAPGSTVVESATALVPYAQVAIGAAFGYNVYAVFVEVDMNFEGGATGATYWMQPAAVSAGVFWEVSSVGTLGEPIHTSELGGAWVADEDGSHGVFKLHCDVATPPEGQCLFSISIVEPITRVVMSNVDNASSATSTIALEDFTDVMIMAEAGGSYDVALEGNTSGSYTNYFTIFIKTSAGSSWDSYETFEIGSITNSSGTDGQQATSNITIPTSLTEGEYLLRVVKNYNTSPLDPCASYSFGQGEDYTLVIGELDDCEGTPDAGVASVNPAMGNTNTTYTVSASGYAFGNGLTYQWQSNTDGAGWDDEGGLEDHYSSFTATAPSENGINVEWRLEVTCTLSSETAYSETATFTTAMVYCTPELDCTDGDMITNVNFLEIDNTTTCSANGYGDYTDMTATVQSGGTYPISVSVGDGWAFESVSVWIDFDGDGTFDQDEFFYIGTGSAEALTGDISIPAGVVDGNYRMRVRVAAVGETTATWDMACDEDQGYGETEDYTVIVDGVVGVDDHVTFDFSYYPNPMEEVLYITSQTDIQSVSAYNVLGQHVLSNKNFADGKVDVSSLPAGTYLFRVTFDSGQSENFTVLKK